MSFRIEKKLFIKKGNLLDFKKILKINEVKNLYPKRNIQSIYFDNLEKKMYLDSIEGVTPRKKIRIRNYPETKNSEFLFETKISSVEGRFKKNFKILLNEYNKYLKWGIFDKDYGQCKPILNIIYDREYFIKEDVRITIDTNIRYSSYKSKVFSNDINIVVELKTNRNKDIDILFKEFPFQEIRFSKYCNGIEHLNLN